MPHDQAYLKAEKKIEEARRVTACASREKDSRFSLTMTHPLLEPTPFCKVRRTPLQPKGGFHGT